MRNIAIRGDKTRGDEVLAILKMLGGVSLDGYSGTIDIYGYYIKDIGIIDCTTCSILNNANYKLYTIDEFWEDFPYKVGDKVRILCKDKDAEVMGANWDSNTECVHYHCLYDRIYNITARAEGLAPIIKTKADEPINIAEILKDAPKGTKLYSPICGECELNCVDNSVTLSIVVSVQECGNFYFTSEGKHRDISNAECLLFPSKENRDWHTFKIEPQFPTMPYECIEELGVENEILQIQGYKSHQLYALRLLLLCRDAWWKVDNDWEPNWTDSDTDKWVIEYYYEDIRVDVDTNSNFILAFRTEEICNKFLKTFRDLIEQCKELL